MVFYEVHLSVDSEIAAPFRSWLTEHVREMVALPGFFGATISLTREEGAAGPDGEEETEIVRWTVRYELADIGALDRYLRDHAPRMRAEGTSRFPSGFRASRSVRLLEETFVGPREVD